MMSDAELLKYDTRARERLLRSGAITVDQLRSHVDSLPDCAEKCDGISVDQPALHRSEGERHPSPVPTRVVEAAPRATVEATVSSLSNAETAGVERSSPIATEPEGPAGAPVELAKLDEPQSSPPAPEADAPCGGQPESASLGAPPELTDQPLPHHETLPHHENVPGDTALAPPEDKNPEQTVSTPPGEPPIGETPAAGGESL